MRSCDVVCRCDLCCLSFRTHRGLLRHNAAVHKLLPQDPSGRPFIQNNPSIPTGFNDLAFIDFSCKKFPHIAQVRAPPAAVPGRWRPRVRVSPFVCVQVWCETNLRRCISKFHRFVCDGCDKAFPLHSALDLHKTASHPEHPSSPHTQEKAEQDEGKDVATEKDTKDDVKPELPAEQASFLQGLGLQHVSTVTAVAPSVLSASGGTVADMFDERRRPLSLRLR